MSLSVPRADLERELAELEQQLAERKRLLEEVKQKEKADNVKEVKEFIQEYNLKPLDLFSLKELSAIVNNTTSASKPKKLKEDSDGNKNNDRKYNTYFNPENPNETWVRRPGPGTNAPDWFKKLKEQPNLKDYLVKKAD